MLRSRLGRTAAAAAAALMLGACSDSPAEPPPVETVELRATGQVRTLDGTLPQGLQVVVGTGANGGAAPVAADGTFDITVAVAPGTVDVLIDVASGPRQVHPALVRTQVAGGVPGAQVTLDVLLVPNRWTIPTGTHAGTEVDISLDRAFTPPCTTPGDTNCEGFYPPGWASAPPIWTDAALPIPVAFDHAASSQAITAADSAAFWSTLEQMNDDFGTALFRAAPFDEITVINDRASGAIIVRVDNTLSGFGAWTNWWWNGAGELYAGLVRARTSTHLHSPSLMTHELLHTHAFKHSCAWTTVMGGYGCGSTVRLSADDVAYAQLARSISMRQRATGAVHALLAARDGERMLLGLPPLAARLDLLHGIRARAAIHGDEAG